MIRIAHWALCTALVYLVCAESIAFAAALQLRPCRLEHPLRLQSVEAQCAVLRVAEDPLAPNRAVIDLRIAVVPALNHKTLHSPLFLLAGGPGQAATDLYVGYAAAFARINRNHDIVLLDQRGTGASSPLQCTYPDDWSEAVDFMREVREATRTCLAKLGDHVRFFTTALAVQDLDAVRRALGYTRIDLYGASYGTRVAEEYMRRFPDHLDAVILDGAVDPQRPIGPEAPIDAQAALDAIINRCRSSADCDKAYPKLDAEFARLRARFGSERVMLDVPDPISGVLTNMAFNRTVFNAALRFLSYSAAQAALLPTLIHEGANGDLVPLAAQAILITRRLGDQLAIGMQNTVVCSEDAPFFAADAGSATVQQKTYQGTDQLDGLNEICALWPRGPVDQHLHSALHSATPTLLLSGTADPVTPPSAAQRLARSLLHHRHLILDGEGHGQLGLGCVPRLMADFLDLRQPETMDAGCLQNHRPPAFFVAASGPAP